MLKPDKMVSKSERASMAPKLLLYFLDKLKDKLGILPVDFTLPWWKIITKQKGYLSIALIGEISYSIFRPLVVMFLGLAFSSGNFSYFLFLFGLWAGMYVISLAGRFSGYIVMLRSIYSVHYQAHRWFLQVDPIFHAQRSSGAILGKIDRGSRSYEDFLYSLINDLLQTLLGVVTIIISFCYQSLMLAFITSIFLGIIIAINYFISEFFIIPYEKRLIRADDKVRSVSVENLAQMNLIRTCFASNESIKKLMARDVKAMRKEGGLWFLYSFFYFLVRVVYLINLFFIGWYLFSYTQQQLLTVPFALSLLLAYLRGTYEIVKIDYPMRNIIKSVARARDLFAYVSSFGKRQFPVLESIEPACRMNLDYQTDHIRVEVKNLYFGYPNQVPLFENYSFALQVSCQEGNKLYGIIGPSGIGKSTLLLLLGGQIKPVEGKILINDVDIYQIDDISRRRKIAIQGQVSTNLRGTLRYNLLFGLPRKEELFSKSELIILLQQVGLWSLFEKKEGLDTFIGEAGLTLSGGQRQRLNFANLYLRARYYKPLLILIDEPTSSLDEISEKSITDMISELAKSAITMVIAHRLNTVKNAAGIIDCSLMVQHKQIEIYSHEELQKVSPYFQKLVQGKISIEEY